jgi:hypothetical protein
LEDNTLLGVLFTVFSQCQALHPDEEEGGEGDFFFDEEEVSQNLNFARMCPGYD